MIKKILFLLVLALSFISNAQFGINGGVSLLKAFGTPKPYIGFHIGGEIPRDDQVSLFGRVSFYAKQKESTEQLTYVQAIDPNTTPSVMSVTYVNSMNYTIIEGGNRYYIGDGYDSGFGAYGGGTLMMIFNSVKRNYSDYDQSKYALIDPNELPKGSIFNLGVGLGGGVKHTLAGVGTLYLDANFAYLIFSRASNTTASSVNLFTPLLFSFNLGFRKDIY